MEDKIRRARQTTTPTPPTDPTVEWAAKLLAPATAIPHASIPQYHIAVAAPIILDGRVDIGLQPRGSSGQTVWTTGAWLGAPSQRRTVIATPTRPRSGLHRVLVRVGDIVHNAGAVVIT
jgi:hypothetical protein